jgi:hypothetical protein
MNHRRTRALLLARKGALPTTALSLALLAVACGGDDPDVTPDTSDVSDVSDASDTTDVADTTDGSGDGDSGEDVEVDDAADSSDGSGEPDLRNPDCDPLNPTECALPWPSNLYLEADSTRATGYTLAFGPTTLPANFRNVPVSPEPFRRLDGYSVQTPIITHWPNLDASGLPNEYQVADSLAEDAEVLFFEVTESGLERVPYWAELDAWEEDPASKVLWVRPGVLLNKGGRYIVAFRNLVDTTGEVFAPGEAFAALQSGETEGDALLSPRQARFDDVFALLAAEGINTSELQLAWDFVVASEDALHRRMLHMRDDALANDPDGPDITVTNWEEHTPETNPFWAAIGTGTLTVPDYMKPQVVDDPSGSITGYVFNDDENGLPQVYATREARFWIGIPHSAMDGTPHGLIQYGHGFFGDAEEVVGSWTANGQIANDHNYIFFGSDWTGMADPDFGTTQFMVFNLNYFSWLSDRSHQGMVEFVLFARAMREQFAEHPYVTENNIEVDTTDLNYMGISQGGIYGATYMAISPDITYGHLGVPGQSYALLEHRSTNFDDFFDALGGAYRGRARQAVLLAAVQTMWDMVDPSSYWPHITADPLEGNEPHYVIAAPSKGDVQVTTISMEIVARSNIGLAPMENYDDVREIGLVDEAPYPRTGSGMVLWHYGPEWPQPATNLPAIDGPVNVHEAPRFNTEHNRQMTHFFRNGGEIIDVCGGDVCEPTCISSDRRCREQSAP